MKSVIYMTTRELLAKFGNQASEQLEIALAENGLTVDHPCWEETFIELEEWWQVNDCMVTSAEITRDRVIRITG